MDLKERSLKEIDRYLKSRGKSYLETYARGDPDKNSKLLTVQFFDEHKRSRLKHIFWSVIPDIYLAGGALDAHRTNHPTLEGLCAFGLGISLVYALREAYLLISPYFFTDELEAKTREVLIPHRKPMYSRPGVSHKM